jgi:hypothetical protein
VLHHPSYSPDLAPPDVCFPNWNHNWKGCVFKTFPQYKQIWQSRSGTFRKARLRNASNHCTSVVNRVLFDKGTMLNTGVIIFLTSIFYFLLT